VKLVLCGIPRQNLITAIEGHYLLAEFPHLRKRFWGRHVWARGYFCRSSGNVTDEVIKAYIAQQSHDALIGFRGRGI
jgi:putative transposase